MTFKTSETFMTFENYHLINFYLLVYLVMCYQSQILFYIMNKLSYIKFLDLNILLMFYHLNIFLLFLYFILLISIVLIVLPFSLFRLFHLFYSSIYYIFHLFLLNVIIRFLINVVYLQISLNIDYSIIIYHFIY